MIEESLKNTENTEKDASIQVQSRLACLEARSIKLLFEETGYIEITKTVLFNLKGFAEEKGLSLDIEWPPGIEWSEEEICLNADRDRVSHHRNPG